MFTADTEDGPVPVWEMKDLVGGVMSKLDEIRERLPDYFTALKWTWQTAYMAMSHFVDDEEQKIGLPGPHARQLFHVAQVLLSRVSELESEFAAEQARADNFEALQINQCADCQLAQELAAVRGHEAGIAGELSNAVNELAAEKLESESLRIRYARSEEQLANTQRKLIGVESALAKVMAELAAANQRAAKTTEQVNELESMLATDSTWRKRAEKAEVALQAEQNMAKVLPEDKVEIVRLRAALAEERAKTQEEIQRRERYASHTADMAEQLKSSESRREAAEDEVIRFKSMKLAGIQNYARLTVREYDTVVKERDSLAQKLEAAQKQISKFESDKFAGLSQNHRDLVLNALMICGGHFGTTKITPGEGIWTEVYNEILVKLGHTVRKWLKDDRPECKHGCIPAFLEGQRAQSCWKCEAEKAESSLAALQEQVNGLAHFIMHNVPHEPTPNEGAIACAIRVIDKLKRHMERTRTAAKLVIRTERNWLTEINYETRSELALLQLEDSLKDEVRQPLWGPTHDTHCPKFTDDARPCDCGSNFSGKEKA